MKDKIPQPKFINTHGKRLFINDPDNPNGVIVDGKKIDLDPDTNSLNRDRGKKCNWFRHNWSKWTLFTKTFVIIPRDGFMGPLSDKKFNTEETWQKRECLDCGYYQEEKIDN